DGLSLRVEQTVARANPVLILTISNGAGHIRVAEGIAAAVRAMQPAAPVLVADVADYMTPLARFTHVTAYLWLVKHAPSAWDRIDRYQKQQPHTSPEWFYRRGCRKLFELAGRVRPRALVATEVGCCEIAALIKRDLALVAGGGEGMGRIEETTARLLQLREPAAQLVVLAGRNERLKARCERLARNGDATRLRVLGWTGPEQMPQLMAAADLMVSKLG